MDKNKEKRLEITKENKMIVKNNYNYIPKTILIKTKNINGLLKSKNDIEILDAMTNQAIKYYLNENSKYNIAVLNFANSITPGGEYLKGSRAQEAELCRTSPYLYASLDLAKNQNFYDSWGNKNWNNQVLYTPNTLFIRDDSSNDYKILNDPYKASVITSAAPDFRKVTDSSKIPQDNKYENVIKQIYYTPLVVKDKKIFDQSIKFGNMESTSKINNDDIPMIDILILGAWGCGSFKFEKEFERNNRTYTYSTYMAERFVNVLSNLGGHYKKICFAIPQSYDKMNYEIFSKIFKENKNNFKSVSFI